MVTACALSQQRFLNDPNKRGKQSKREEGKERAKTKQRLNMTLRGSNHANLIQPNLRPHQLGIAQIIAFNTHIERYNDIGMAFFWYAAAIKK